MEKPQRIIRPATAFSLSGGKKRPRRQDADHLKWIRTLPCVVRGHRQNTEAAHIRYADLRYGKRDTGKAEKPDDRWAIPLSADEHRKQHDGNEQAYWHALGIDPCAVALALHSASGDDEAAKVILEQARHQ